MTALPLPAVLSRFRTAYPEVSIELTVAGSDDIEAAIADGDLDIGLLGFATHREPKRADWRRIGTDRLVVVVGCGHRLVGRKRVRPADLGDEVFADFPAGSPGRAQSDVAFAGIGVTRTVAFEAMIVSTLLELVAADLAIAMIPSRLVPDTAGLVRIPVTDGPQRHEYLAWSSFHPSAAARAFLTIADADLQTGA